MILFGLFMARHGVVRTGLSRHGMCFGQVFIGRAYIAWAFFGRGGVKRWVCLAWLF